MYDWVTCVSFLDCNKDKDVLELHREKIQNVFFFFLCKVLLLYVKILIADFFMTDLAQRKKIMALSNVTL